MADLSAVLRKTIDGLPKATPQLRAKVYEKARAAIARQIETANPPLSNDVIEARRSALEDAIDRTEDHYLDRELSEAAADVAPEFQKAPQAPAPREAPVAAPQRPSEPVRTPATPRPSLPNVANGPVGTASAAPPAQKPAWPTSAPPVEGASSTRPELRRDPAAPQTERAAPPVRHDARPDEAATRPPERSRATPSARPPERRDPPVDGFNPSRLRETEPSAGFDTSQIPAADLAAPRYANGRREAKASRGRGAILAGLAIVILGGGGALAYVYQDQIQALLKSAVGTRTAATTTPAATPSAGTQPPTASDADTAAANQAESEGEGTDVAALPATPSTTPDATPSSAAVSTPAAPASTRRFTQRLMPDGTEIDAGPGAGNANAFEEGTNIAAASPETLAPAVTPTPEITATAVPDAAAQPPATAPADAPRTAALQPSGVPAVAQKAVFYEERSETEQGTQRGGNVVWTVVNEPPADGQPPEPAIRGVVDVPEENIKLTMTIRRNADATLPASHVIELMFDVPANFPGGQIANVQRLALKPTEEARGEPLIGVAGKISDGFFIIALNNLAQATQTNLDLMGKEQWIDIPVAYATGRRALMSIEKGIPGDRVFKEAMDAWAAKT